MFESEHVLKYIPGQAEFKPIEACFSGLWTVYFLRGLPNQCQPVNWAWLVSPPTFPDLMTDGLVFPGFACRALFSVANIYFLFLLECQPFWETTQKLGYNTASNKTSWQLLFLECSYGVALVAEGLFVQPIMHCKPSSGLTLRNGCMLNLPISTLIAN